jgi:hypothetical protein
MKDHNSESAAGIIPGNRGKADRNWCGPPLRGASQGRQISPVPLDGVAADPVLRQWNCAARREAETASESCQVRGLFRAPHRCSYPEGCGCYCITRTQRRVPEGPPFRKARPRKAGRERDAAPRGAERVWQSPRTSSLGRREKTRHPTASRKQPES